MVSAIFYSIHLLLDEQNVTFKLNSLMDNVHLLIFYFCNSEIYLTYRRFEHFAD